MVSLFEIIIILFYLNSSLTLFSQTTNTLCSSSKIKSTKVTTHKKNLRDISLDIGLAITLSQDVRCKHSLSICIP